MPAIVTLSTTDNSICGFVNKSINQPIIKYLQNALYRTPFAVLINYAT